MVIRLSSVSLESQFSNTNVKTIPTYLPKLHQNRSQNGSPFDRTLAVVMVDDDVVLQCFTSIVGPNGSGKSNVIDSMLFVFGYRAKQIRSKKVSVLIHNSEQHQNLTFCTVSVHFQKIVDLVCVVCVSVSGTSMA